MSEACNDQPTWNGSAPTNLSTSAEGAVQPFNDRWGYIDFGADFADIRIHQVWTRYRNWSAGDVRAFGEYGWASSWDTWNIPTLVPETQIKLSSQAALAYANDPQWVMDVDLSADPVAPAGRYLFIRSLTTGGADRATEFAFIGTTVVPEPTALAALGLTTILLLRRRP